MPITRDLPPILIPSPIIDMDISNNLIPPHWKVIDHQLPNVVCGQVEWNPNETELYLAPAQITGQKMIQGFQLMNYLISLNLVVLNDNVIDFYERNHRVPTPESWQDKRIYCWGRLYRGSGNYLIVRSLDCKSDGTRSSNFSYVGGEFCSKSYALIQKN